MPLLSEPVKSEDWSCITGFNKNSEQSGLESSCFEMDLKFYQSVVAPVTWFDSGWTVFPFTVSKMAFCTNNRFKCWIHADVCIPCMGTGVLKTQQSRHPYCEWNNFKNSDNNNSLLVVFFFFFRKSWYFSGSLMTPGFFQIYLKPLKQAISFCQDEVLHCIYLFVTYSLDIFFRRQMKNMGGKNRDFSCLCNTH